MSKFKPYLSIVAASRNDTHGGDMKKRMQIFLNGVAAQAQKHEVPVELIMVEWNPPQDRLPLAEELDWPKESDYCTIRVITVPPEYHNQYEVAQAYPFIQMVAKNVGIRRARGEFILATNVDIIFSDEMFEFFAQKKLEKGKLYRSDRYDIDDTVPLSDDIDKVLDFCENNVVRLNTRYGSTDFKTNQKASDLELKEEIQQDKILYTNACGDFQLMHREDWVHVQGYTEIGICSMHQDSLFAYNVYVSGIEEYTFKYPLTIYHIEHGGGWVPSKAKDFNKTYKKRRIRKISSAEINVLRDRAFDNGIFAEFSDSNWGFADSSFEEAVVLNANEDSIVEYEVLNGQVYSGIDSNTNDRSVKVNKIDLNLSVVVYDAFESHLLKATLESLAMCRNEFDEIVVVCSGELESEIDLRSSTTKCSFIESTGKGSAADRNKVLDNLDSEYLLWVKAGDLINGDVVNQFKESVAENHNVGILYCDKNFVSNDGHIEYSLQSNEEITKGFVRLQFLLMRQSIFSGSLLFVRSSIYKSLRFNEEIIERVDDELLARCALDIPVVKISQKINSVVKHLRHQQNKIDLDTKHIMKVILGKYNYADIFPALRHESNDAALAAIFNIVAYHFELLGEFGIACDYYNKISNIDANLSANSSLARLKYIQNDLNKAMAYYETVLESSNVNLNVKRSMLALESLLKSKLNLVPAQYVPCLADRPRMLFVLGPLDGSKLLEVTQKYMQKIIRKIGRNLSELFIITLVKDSAIDDVYMEENKAFDPFVKAYNLVMPCETVLSTKLDIILEDFIVDNDIQLVNIQSGDEFYTQNLLDYLKRTNKPLALTLMGNVDRFSQESLSQADQINYYFDSDVVCLRENYKAKLNKQKFSCKDELYSRSGSKTVNFAFVGDIRPGSGIEEILKSFKTVEEDCLLYLWGGGPSDYLGEIVEYALKDDTRVEYVGDATADIFYELDMDIDAIIVGEDSSNLDMLSRVGHDIFARRQVHRVNKAESIFYYDDERSLKMLIESKVNRLRSGSYKRMHNLEFCSSKENQAEWISSLAFLYRRYYIKNASKDRFELFDVDLRALVFEYPELDKTVLRIKEYVLRGREQMAKKIFNREFNKYGYEVL